GKLLGESAEVATDQVADRTGVQRDVRQGHATGEDAGQGRHVDLAATQDGPQGGGDGLADGVLRDTGQRRVGAPGTAGTAGATAATCSAAGGRAGATATA